MNFPMADTKGGFELDAEAWEALQAFRRTESDLPSVREAARRLIVQALVERKLLRADSPPPPRPRSGEFKKRGTASK
jgi:hypothetical protein